MTNRDMRGLEFTLLRVTIELTSPLTIGTGGSHDFVDTPCVTDAEGLPAIPGSSLAGVLRHLAAGDEDPDRSLRCTEAFGFQRGNDGDASLIEVSWGQVHDENDCPVPMRSVRRAGDETLAFLAAGTTRDHVRLNGHGAVDGDGKYDVHSVPAGARFTFEIVVHAGSPVDAAEIVALLQSPWSRLGGSARRGLGAFKVARAHTGQFDLRKAAGRAAFLRLPRALHEPVPAGILTAVAVEAAGAPRGVFRGCLRLAPQDLWLVGGGNADDFPGISQAGRDGIDLVPLSERRIVWRGGKAGLSAPQALLPGSSVKGALRHRTAFHARRLRRAWAHAGSAEARGVPEEIDDLFGSVKERSAEDRDVHEDAREGAPGCLFIEDCWIEDPETLALDHVSLDRFSGGPLDGHLFSEAPLFGIAVEIPLALDLRGRSPTDELRARALSALRASLRDLCRGRLALGSGSNKGHGYFSGLLTWDGPGPWEGNA